jgi:hypothetical protein
MNARANLSLIVASAAISLTATTTFAQYTIPWSTTDGGGARIAAGQYRLSGTVGQGDATAPRAAANGTTVTGGFWAAPPPACVGDFNSDGLINTLDLTRFLGSFGQTVTPGSPQANTDLNNDGVVNVSDLTIFLGRFGQAC